MNEQITERVHTYIRIKNIMKVEVAARFGWGQPQFRNLGNGLLRLWVRSPCEPHGYKNQSATLTATDWL